MKLKKINDKFPYNGNQAWLHVSEEDYLNNLKGNLIASGFTGRKKEDLRKKQLRKVREIKEQDPHPAKVLAYYPGFFWDYDLYWCHWKWDRKLIIPRMLQVYEEEHIQLLEKFYTKKEIIDIMRQTREFVPYDTYSKLGERYGVKIEPRMGSFKNFFNGKNKNH